MYINNVGCYDNKWKISDLGLSDYYVQVLSTPFQIFVIHYTELKEDSLEKVI